MHDRWQESGREDRPGREQQGAMHGETQYGASSQAGQGTEMSRWDESGGRTGDWQGYVVPYRYYGPGYRGVGYYSVMYQGSGGEGRQPESGWRQGDQPQGSESGFGQRSGFGQSGFGQRSGFGQQSGRGGFAGRGPKGYLRSDERLGEEISDRLMANDDLDASDIEVQVRGGEVTLSGTVQDRWMKRLAEDLAERVMGVRDVMNQIRVQDEEAGSRATSVTATSRTGRTGTKPMTRTEDPIPNGKRQPETTGTR